MLFNCNHLVRVLATVLSVSADVMHTSVATAAQIIYLDIQLNHLIFM